MKTSDINEILKSFCQNQNYRAILIDGKWGIGKTYEFKKYFDSLKKKDKKRIYYFTIFGTETIDELNTSIFRKIHPFWSYFRVGYKTISKSVDAVAGIKNSTLNVHFNLDYLLDLAEPQNIRKNPILIFDDIERFSNDNFLFFLGLLYKLNLQGARIICLISSEKLKDKEKIFQEYKEKVFDAVYKIEEPSLDVFNTTFDVIKDDQRRILLDRCHMNIRFLKKAHLLFKRIIEKVGDPKNWIIDQYSVIIACCYAVQIVLGCTLSEEKIDKENFDYFSKAEEFGEDIAINFMALIKNEELDKTDKLISSLITCVLRIYLFDNYESLKRAILRQQDNEKSLLNQSFFLLSDENKDKYVSLFAEVMKDKKIKYDRNYLQILGDIIRYYKNDISDDLIRKFVEKYFNACDKEKELGFSEIVYWLKDLESMSHGQEINRIKKTINIVENKLSQLQKQYYTNVLLHALKDKDTLYLDDFTKRFDFLQKLVDLDEIKSELIKHDYYLPNLSNDISQNEWHFAHEITSVVHLLELDDYFIEYANAKVNVNDSYTLKYKLEALIRHRLGKNIDLLK